VNAIVFALV